MYIYSRILWIDFMIFDSKKSQIKTKFRFEKSIEVKMNYMFHWSRETILKFLSIKGYETYINHADDQLKHVPCIQ